MGAQVLRFLKILLKVYAWSETSEAFTESVACFETSEASAESVIVL